jgi:parallel beta-helix repeat protein
VLHSFTRSSHTIPLSPVKRRLSPGRIAAATLLTGAVALAGVILAPATAHAATVTNVSTSAQLKTALGNAKPGDTIHLTDGTYTGKFEASAAGTGAAPITLTGSRAAVLTTGSTGSGYALHVTGGHWNLTGFRVDKAAKGIVLDDSDYTVISSVDVGHIGQEGVHVRHSSTNVVLRNSYVHDTGLTSSSYGEGVYVGSANSNWSSVMGSSSSPDKSDNVLIQNNRIEDNAAEGIDIKEGTTGGRITGNTFRHSGYSGDNSADSWVDVKGNGYAVSGNSGSSTLEDAFQVHSVLSGWGGGNDFAANTVTGGVPGYEVNNASTTAGNVVHCKTSGAGSGLTNKGCK